MTSTSSCSHQQQAAAAEPKKSSLDDYDSDLEEEYTEEMESPDEDETGSCKPCKHRCRRISDPDHRWDNAKSSQVSCNSKENHSSSNNNHVKHNRRGDLKRSASVDGSGFIFNDVGVTKRHTWDGSSSKGMPDFRWDKLKEAVVGAGDDHQQVPLSCSSLGDHFGEKQRLSSPTQQKSPGKIRRKPPRRCKSEAGGMSRLALDSKQQQRPLLTRTNSKVRFCLADNVYFEVPRTPKEQKQDLFYTKREIKVFKAEKKEEKKEKKEQRREEKERLKTEQNAIMDKMKAKASKSMFAPATCTTQAIASAC